MTLGFSAFLHWFWSAVFAEGLGWDIKKMPGLCFALALPLVYYKSSSR